VSAKKILIVDDEPQIVRVLRGYLERAGFQVVAAGDGSEALKAFRRERPDFVILDLNLPGMDGLDVAHAIRRESNIPILMLTARVEEADRITGLELGADDYVTKPFSPREIVARVRAIFRRMAENAGSTETLRAGDIEINLTERTVTVKGKPVNLTPTEFALLVIMARYPRRVFTRLQLLEQALGTDYPGYERTIDAHIKNLRAKIEPDPRRPTYIQTVFGVGYKLEVEPHA